MRKLITKEISLGQTLYRMDGKCKEGITRVLMNKDVCIVEWG